MNASEYAEPGDDDLCCDIRETKVNSVTVYGPSEMMLVLEGGSGILTEEGVASHWERITRLELNFGFDEDSGNEEFMQMLADKLEGWRVEGTPLRLLSAPGRVTTLVKDRSDWVPVPCGVVGT